VADPLQALLAGDAVPKTSFPPTSRYAACTVETYDPGGGARAIPYLERRFCPLPERLGTLAEVRVVGGDRRDLLAAANLGDAELWWRIADVNGVVDPRTLTSTPGTFVRIPLPEGAPGGTDD
jgi:hypothetical protein